tara:strand:- start:956 stop:1207 length:252 start_codon:yes stop_codon:yes gene_type:complete
MVKKKILYFFMLIIPICKIIDVLLALMYSIGKVSFEWDGAYYIVMGFINQNLFKENKLILLSLIVMLLMTFFSILIKYKFISY